MKLKLTENQIRYIIKEEIIKGRLENVRLEMSPDLYRCNNLSDVILDFCNYTSDSLDIERSLVNINIVDNRENSSIKTTAYYNPESHEIVIYGKNRAIVDICRSIAHEMTHMAQMLEDRIKFPVQDAGGEIEDEANAKAGEIIKLFAKSSPERSKIYESVIKSNQLI